MQFIGYIRGEGRKGKLVSLGFTLHADPKVFVTTLQGTMPFDVHLAAVEEGSPERLEQLKTQFQAHHLHGFWYAPVEVLTRHIEGVNGVDPAIGKTKRVSLDLEPEEFSALEHLVDEKGEKSKAQLLRKAFRLYNALYRYKSQGYMIQAVKGGKMLQFHDLEDVR